MAQNKKRYFYDVICEEKMPISEVSEFSILPSENFHLLQIFIVAITLSMGKVKTFH